MGFYLKLLARESFHLVLLQVDLGLLEEARQGRCPWCGGPLHRSDYDRAARGVPSSLRGIYARRFSCCCGREGCRHRVTPFSARFMGGKQHVAAVMVLCSAMLHGVTGRRAARIRERFGVSRSVAEHWRGWWRRLELSPFWRSVRGRLAPAFEAGALPASLLGAFAGEAGERLVSVLRFLLPVTSGSAPGGQAI